MTRFKTGIVLCVLSSLLAAMPMSARQMSLDEAVRYAAGDLKKSPSRSGSPELLYTQQAGDLNVAYVLATDDGDGYVVLAADDVLPAVLGYSDTGRFDAASIPPAMDAWMQEYGRQLTYAIANGYQTAGASRATVSHPSISPLCKATWGQSSPFSDNCPETSNGKHSPAGCVATAMSQVMYVHKWPVTGTGENTYVSESFHETRTFNFGATTFDWANMLPSYSAGYTPAQGAAVAKLLEACGNAALMNYGASSSGAFPYNAIYGMINFMKYDKSASLLQRDYYSAAAWDQIIYNELAAGRPVIYGGYTADYTAGHSFVVDGYSKDGYYHLNWGWSGLSNGYFLLSALDPADQGIGGSSSGYNYKQDAVIRIMPAKEGSKYQLEVFWDGPFTSAQKSYANMAGTYIEFIAGSNGFYQGSILETSKATMGIKLTPVGGGEAVFYPGSEVEFASHYGKTEYNVYGSFYLATSQLPTSGDYIATPAFKFNDEVKDVAVKVGEVNSLKISCTKRGVSIEEIAVSRTLTADNLKALTPMYSGKTCTVTADIHNTGSEYFGMVKAGIANSEGTVLAWLENVPVSVPDGESVAVTFTGSLVLMTNGQPLTPGDYTLSVYDEAGTKISSPLSVSITEAPTGKPMYYMDFNVTGVLSGEGTSVNPYIVGDEFDIAITVSVSSGLFDDTVALYAYYDNNKEVDFSGENSNSKTFFAGPNMTQTNTYVIGTLNFEVGKTVYIQPYGWNNDMSDESTGWFNKKIYVKRVMTGINEVEAVNTGIYPNPAVSSTTVTAKAPITSIDVYSISGAKVMSVGGNGSQVAEINVSGLQAGHYILMVKTTDGVENYRLMKR